MVEKKSSKSKSKPARVRPVELAKPADAPSDAEEVTASHADACEPVEVSEPESEVDQFAGKLYTISSWKGLPNFECLWCAFATVDHEAALEHAVDAHAPKEPEEQLINTGLVDGSGEPITRAVQPAKEV